jgi:dihydrofolate reductase
MSAPRAPLAIVVAMNADRVIGVGGDLPWRIREDLRHFKRVTMGHAIIMGRKTWDSIGRPLPGRQNIVVTRNTALKIEGVDVVHSLEAAIDLARASGDAEPCVIGGATLYSLALPLATRLHLTEVDRQVDGDTFFPRFGREEWTELSRREAETEGVTFLELERADQAPQGGF